MPNVHLGSHFEAFISRKLEDGRYQNASDVVRAGLRLLEDAEATRVERAAWVAAELDAAFNDEVGTRPAADVFDELERRHALKSGG